MEKDLNNDEFELFLKQKADQYKLYPSDKAWKRVYGSLHPGMKWFKVGGSFLILSSLFFIFQQTFFLDSSHLPPNRKTSTNLVASNANASEQIARPADNISQNQVTNNGSVVNDINNSAANNHLANKPANAIDANLSNSVSLPNFSALYHAGQLLNGTQLSSLPHLNNPSGTQTPSTPDSKSSIVNNQLKGYLLRTNQELRLSTIPTIVSIPSNHRALTAQNKEIDQPEMGEGKELKMAVVKANAARVPEEITLKNINWLEEMAVIKLTTHKKNPFNIQFYFSPTVSYRKLADNQNSSHTGPLNVPVALRDLNINNYVDQSPAIGAELGSNILFSISRNFTLKTGLQFNYTRYNIKAFKYSYEKASIALNTSGPVPDTISSYTSLRNFNGYAPLQLQNQYLQLSVPVGAELKVAGNKRLQFSVASTIQPTFLLFSNSYLLSTNYLNYTKEPSLVRKFNVNTSLEAFLSYKTGGLRWQLGPQFRYQLMSSFSDRYPIKEYMFEYGIKIGISKTIR